jgi:hypothetical protein
VNSGASDLWDAANEQSSLGAARKDLESAAEEESRRRTELSTCKAELSSCRHELKQRSQLVTAVSLLVT